MPMTSNHAPHRVSYFLIVTACLLLLLSFGYRSSFGLFVKPITDANGWGRETIALALAIQNLFWGIVAVFAGALADRFGNVRVIVAGAAFYALGMGLMSGIDSPGNDHPDIAEAVGQRAGKHGHNTPKQILDGKGQGDDFAAPAVGIGYGLDEQPEAGSIAKRQTQQ